MKSGPAIEEMVACVLCCYHKTVIWWWKDFALSLATSAQRRDAMEVPSRVEFCKQAPGCVCRPAVQTHGNPLRAGSALALARETPLQFLSLLQTRHAGFPNGQLE